LNVFRYGFRENSNENTKIELFMNSFDCVRDSLGENVFIDENIELIVKGVDGFKFEGEK
jgi:hypothetical protein